MIVVDNENIRVDKLELEIDSTGYITNTYVIKDKRTQNICVIDPAFDENIIRKAIEKMNGKLQFVIITHSHADHIAALAKLVECTIAKVYINELDYEGLYNKALNAEEIVQTKVLPVDEQKVIAVKDNEIINLGDTNFKILHTPGHTRGSISLVDEKNNILYSGDTIFENTYGRTDLITGSSKDMKESLDKLFTRFEDIQVLPGHGEIFNLKNSKRKIRLLFAYKG